MCLCRSNGTGVVVRRRVAADARLPVAILLPVLSPSSPPPTVTIFVLVAVLMFTAVSCSPTYSADGTDRTGSSENVDRVFVTTSGDPLTSTDFGDIVTSSREVTTQTTTENVKKFTSLDANLQENNEFQRTLAPMSTQLQRGTANNRHFRSSVEPEIAIDNTNVFTWSRLHRHEKAVSSTSSFLVSTSAGDNELATTPQSRLIDIHQSTTANTLSADKMLAVSSKTTTGEDLTTTLTTFDDRTRVTGTPDVTDVEVLSSGATESGSQRDDRSTVETKLDRVGGGDVDGFHTEYVTDSISTDSNTPHNLASRRFTPPTKTSSRSSTTNRTTSRVGERKRCLQMRTGGNDSPAMDCYQDRVVDDGGLSGTIHRRRRLEFCDAYSAYVADFDCAPSSLCLDFVCPEVVRLDRVAQAMNDLFIDRIMNYDCDNRYSGVWNCSACKVTSSSSSSLPPPPPPPPLHSCKVYHYKSALSVDKCLPAGQ